MEISNYAFNRIHRWYWGIIIIMTNTFVRVPPQKFMVTADYFYPGWEWPVDFFAIQG